VTTNVVIKYYSIKLVGNIRKLTSLIQSTRFTTRKLPPNRFEMKIDMPTAN